MPHIRFRAIDSKDVQKLSASLTPALAKSMGTSEDNFTFELLHTDFFALGKKITSYPFVEVFWFERPKEVQDLSARIITEQIKALCKAEDVVVIFQILQKSSYYENGNHF